MAKIQEIPTAERSQSHSASPWQRAPSAGELHGHCGGD